MIPDCKRRLKTAYDDLKKLVVSGDVLLLIKRDNSFYLN